MKFFIVFLLMALAVGTLAHHCPRPDKGPCRGDLTVWVYWDETNDCTKFSYGGCKGNSNRYNTRDECLKACKH